MPRPQKTRRVNSIPGATHFKPAGIPLRMMEEVIVSIEEAEAVRLKDLEGLGQEGCAVSMNVSRPTFQRILLSARQKIADALLNGKAIRINGGNFEMAFRRYRCHNGHEWNVSFELLEYEPPRYCPTCNSSLIAPFLMGEQVTSPRRRRRGGNSWRSDEDSGRYYLNT